MSKKFTLGSFLKHPQLKSGHANKESEKLQNHDTSGAPVGTSASGASATGTAAGGGGSDTPEKPAPITGGY